MSTEDIHVIDINKQVRNWQYVLDTYGNVQIVSPIGAAFRVVGVTEIEGMMAFQCAVQNAAGGAVVGQRVAYEHGDVQDIEVTGGAGVAEHTAGAGEKYDPNYAQGPVTWRVLDAASEAIVGIGWLSGTNHRHLNVLMQWDEGGEPPPPPDGGDVVAAIDRLTAAIKGLTVTVKFG